VAGTWVLPFLLAQVQHSDGVACGTDRPAASALADCKWQLPFLLGKTISQAEQGSVLKIVATVVDGSLPRFKSRRRARGSSQAFSCWLVRTAQAVMMPAAGVAEWLTALARRCYGCGDQVRG
jgi:hypothetical protein